MNPDRPVVQPVVRHYTAWATPTHSLLPRYSNLVYKWLLVVVHVNGVRRRLWTAATNWSNVHLRVWTATVEWHWQCKTEELREKSIPLPLCTPQNPHGLIRARTWSSAVRGRDLPPKPRHGHTSLTGNLLNNYQPVLLNVFYWLLTDLPAQQLTSLTSSNLLNYWLTNNLTDLYNCFPVQSLVTGYDYGVVSYKAPHAFRYFMMYCDSATEF
jgi:hypothetical protein